MKVELWVALLAARGARPREWRELSPNSHLFCMILLPSTMMRTLSQFAFLLQFLYCSMEHNIVYPQPPEGSEYRGPGLTSRRSDRPAPADDSFLNIVDRRVSVRAFTDAPVSDQVLHSALRVCRLAPSAGNRQAYHVVIVRDAGQKLNIARAAVEQMWIAEAPVVVVFLADPERSGSKYHDRGRFLYSVQDATIAAAYFQLALEAAGLSSCWVGAFREDFVAQAIGVTATPIPIGSMPLRPVVVMPVGEAAERPRRRHRRAVREFVHYGSIGGATASDLPQSSVQKKSPHDEL